MAFIELREDLQKWDIDLIINDLSNLIESTGSTWELWKKHGKIIHNGKQERQINLNLTSNPTLFPNLYDRLWMHSGCRFEDSKNIDDGDLYILHPELEGTYTAKMINFMQLTFGPIRVRVHNKVHKDGLYWHKDRHAPTRYHLALWTNPGAFIVWTDKKLRWEGDFDPEQTKEEFTINAKFIPMNGQFYSMETGSLVHGVCNIGVGHDQDSAEQSRCHFTFGPVTPRS